MLSNTTICKVHVFPSCHNKHKLGGVKQKFILSQFLKADVQSKVLAGQIPDPSGISKGESSLGSSGFYGYSTPISAFFFFFPTQTFPPRLRIRPLLSLY